MGTPEWSDDRTEGQRRWGRVALIVIAAIVLFGVGVLVGRGLSPESELPPTESAPANEEIGPRDVVNGVPVGYERTEAGAVVAATNFARLMSSPSGDRSTYIRSVEIAASNDWAPEARRLAGRTFRFARERYGDRGSVVFVPVRYRVASYSDDLAEIELWGTAIGSALDSGIFEQSWVIASIELVWVDDDWRVRGQGSRAGPAPASIEAEPGIDDLEGFREYSYGPRP
jgi:hypothetical protein